VLVPFEVKLLKPASRSGVRVALQVAGVCLPAGVGGLWGGVCPRRLGVAGWVARRGVGGLGCAVRCVSWWFGFLMLGGVAQLLWCGGGLCEVFVWGGGVVGGACVWGRATGGAWRPGAPCKRRGRCGARCGWGIVWRATGPIVDGKATIRFLHPGVESGSLESSVPAQIGLGNRHVRAPGM